MVEGELTDSPSLGSDQDHFPISRLIGTNQFLDE
jgi:hypothetical protein